MATSLEEVLGAIRVRVEMRRQSALDRAAAIKKAADDYAAAVEKEALAEMAERAGVPVDVEASSSARQAAEALRAIVVSLPELSKGPPAPKAPPKTVAVNAKEAPKPANVSPANAKEPLSARMVMSEELRATAAGSKAGGKASRAEAGPEPADYPLLREAARHGRVVVLGGVARKDRLERVEGRLGFDAEWIETDRPGNNAVRKLEGRILDGRIAAVVVLDGLIGHAHFEPIARATRQTGTLLVYGDKAGRASLDQAFSAAEAQLAKKG